MAVLANEKIQIGLIPTVMQSFLQLLSSFFCFFFLFYTTLLEAVLIGLEEGRLEPTCICV